MGETVNLMLPAVEIAVDRGDMHNYMNLTRHVLGYKCIETYMHLIRHVLSNGNLYMYLIRRVLGYRNLHRYLMLGEVGYRNPLRQQIVSDTLFLRGQPIWSSQCYSSFSLILCLISILQFMSDTWFALLL